MTFLEFLQQKDNALDITEAFKNDASFKKVAGLISTVLQKESGKNIHYLWPDTYTKDGKEYLCQLFGVVTDNKYIDNVVSIDYITGSTANTPESVSFFDDADIQDYLFGSDEYVNVKSKLTVYIKGASVAYFIPIITRVLKTGDYSLTPGETEKLAKTVYKEDMTSGFFNINGAIAYGDLKYNIIKAGGITEAATELETARKAAGQKMRASVAAGDKDSAKQFRKEYLDMIDAIKGGAKTLAEFDVYVKNKETARFSARAVAGDKAASKFKEEAEKLGKDPETAFKEMRGYLNMVVSGIQPGLIICGAPGIGKTYRVEKFLKSRGYNEDIGNLHIIKGRCTARNLYLDLYNFKSKGNIILIDDADSLIGPKAPEDTINLLKAALDSNSGGGRSISYKVGGRLIDDDGQEVPKSFKYNGSVIVLTNYTVGQLDTAIKGRVFTQDLSFSTQQMLDLVKSIMTVIGEGVLSPSAKMKAYDYLSELSESGTNMEVSIRSFVTCARLFQMGNDDKDFSDDDIKSMIKDQVEHQAARGGKKY